MIRLAVFDMDGTLADTSPGILNSHRFAHAMMGRKEPTADDLNGVIGGPLLGTYQSQFRFPEKEARRAVEFYRHHYAEKGIYEAELYPGIKELLIKLKQDGLFLGVATLKSENFAKLMLQNMEIYSYFDIVCGMDEADTRTKSGLIRTCMDTMEVSVNETVLIGDSIHDLNGSEECGVSFIGVTYGFGFTGSETSTNMIFCKNPCEILNAIKKLNL
ncbi:HAD hydrolase-like protein [Aminipila luticellarii]|uniref:HAD family hydrolase n=1 Tax=Aminipila luticellarii TaxID=2507160 RepID=A0A410PSM9_9FIRM|nr:HAD hydrolase-like protein [Aminipila luticellarii]QAT41923.1 HAD family hydrolase [Aminipila luticellarii]